MSNVLSGTLNPTQSINQLIQITIFFTNLIRSCSTTLMWLIVCRCQIFDLPSRNVVLTNQSVLRALAEKNQILFVTTANLLSVYKLWQ